MELSVVIPIYNESLNIQALCAEVTAALQGCGLTYELILVDDGSVDASFAIMEEVARDDPQVRVIRLGRNFGQTAAMTAGFDVAKGRVIVPMDGDLQNDPADIPRLIKKLEEGYDVVSGWRKDRQDVFVTRRLPSVLANRLISKITGVKLNDYGCTLKAYRREVLSAINLYGELHRFVPALTSLVGARVAELPVSHRSRRAGQSKYGIDRTLRVILDLITVKFLLRYSTRPLQLFGKWAVWSVLVGIVAGGTTVYMKLFEGLNMNRNPLMILSAFALFSGIQFVALGLLGELVTRTYHETQGKAVYVVRETRNVDPPG